MLFRSEGNDTLVGGAGGDGFVFNAKLDAKKNVDSIVDFSASEDRIVLAQSVFSKLALGNLSAGAFRMDGAPTSKNACILYSSSTGALSYDADGSGKGKAVLFAVIDPQGLQNGPLTSDQILVA